MNSCFNLIDRLSQFHFCTTKICWTSVVAVDVERSVSITIVGERIFNTEYYFFFGDIAAELQLRLIEVA